MELLAGGSESTLLSKPASASDSSKVQPASKACRSGQGDYVAPKSSSSWYRLTIVKADSVSWSGSSSHSTCLPLPAVGAELGCCPPEQPSTSRQSHDLDGGVEWMSPTGPPGSVSAHRPLATPPTQGMCAAWLPWSSLRNIRSSYPLCPGCSTSSSPSRCLFPQFPLTFFLNNPKHQPSLY